jgi:hypothetical protein
LKAAAERSKPAPEENPPDSKSLKDALEDAMTAQDRGDKFDPRTSLESTAGAAAPRRTEDAQAAPAPSAPVAIGASFGQLDITVGPSDSTSAAGSDRYIELVNRRFGIYAYNSGTPLAQGTLAQLTAFEGGNPSVFDPQIMWDPDTNRFYYVADVVFSASDTRLAFGFSKTATPASATDFCQYGIGFGARFLDYPKLGDSQNRILIGANAFDAFDNYLGSDLVSVTKPPAGETCPEPNAFSANAFFGLPTQAGPLAFTPVPANQTDGSTTGYVVAITNDVFSVPADKLSIYTATETGTTIMLTVTDLTVPSYAVPANAQQPGTTNRLDALDSRNTQAVSAIDPARGSVVGLWTQHTIFGGAGAAVRWYEINPAMPSILQVETIAAPSFYFFNAAISPDRIAVGATRRFGESMAMGLNASATNLRASILAASRLGAAATGFKFVLQSPAVLNDFTCDFGVCRWGDYSGATPLPINVPSWTRGVILHTNQFVRAPGGAVSGWATINMYIVPN